MYQVLNKKRARILNNRFRLILLSFLRIIQPLPKYKFKEVDLLIKNQNCYVKKKQ